MVNDSERRPEGDAETDQNSEEIAQSEEIAHSINDAGDDIEQLAADLIAKSDGVVKHGRRKPRFNADDLRMKLRHYDRQPFLDLLQHWIDNSPAAEDIEKLAKRSPDKYVSAITQLARIAGFTEKTEATVDVNINVSRMSDSQLEDELAKHGLLVDASYSQVLTPSAEGGVQLSNTENSGVGEANSKLPSLVRKK